MEVMPSFTFQCHWWPSEQTSFTMQYIVTWMFSGNTPIYYMYSSLTSENCKPNVYIWWWPMMSYRENTINFAVVMVIRFSSIFLPLCLECLVFMLYLHLNQMTQFIQFIFPQVTLVYKLSSVCNSHKMLWLFY